MLDTLALSFLEGIGPHTANAILNHFGSASEFFHSDADTCRQAGLNKEIADHLPKLTDEAYRRAEEQIKLPNIPTLYGSVRTRLWCSITKDAFPGARPTASPS